MVYLNRRQYLFIVKTYFDTLLLCIVTKISGCIENTFDFIFLLFKTFSVLRTFGLKPLVRQALLNGCTMENVNFLYQISEIYSGRAR